MFKVKICGVTSMEDALLAAEAGADAIGLNFYEKSPRCITAEQAEEIVSRLREDYSPDRVAVFGVFVNASLDDILWTIRAANLYGVEQGVGLQLHGDEPPEYLRDLQHQGLGVAGHLLQASGHIPTVPVIRAFRCRGSDLAAERAYLDACLKLSALPQAVLLDSYQPGTYGGTGHTADWQAVVEQREALQRLPVILAGGLTPGNVAEAIATARPDGVDVASGVESAPGKKDPVKVLAFVAYAKQAFRKLEPHK